MQVAFADVQLEQWVIGKGWQGLHAGRPSCCLGAIGLRQVPTSEGILDQDHQNLRREWDFCLDELLQYLLCLALIHRHTAKKTNSERGHIETLIAHSLHISQRHCQHSTVEETLDDEGVAPGCDSLACGTDLSNEFIDPLLISIHGVASQQGLVHLVCRRDCQVVPQGGVELLHELGIMDVCSSIKQSHCRLGVAKPTCMCLQVPHDLLHHRTGADGGQRLHRQPQRRNIARNLHLHLAPSLDGGRGIARRHFLFHSLPHLLCSRFGRGAQRPTACTLRPLFAAALAAKVEVNKAIA
mmetsp:Transcript_29029/g.72919  ORF Transcript_29029/g.72919 Transcript_29029/m.72919 type:complete len:297 (+) Transcript_29029:2038-2928(+)